LAWSAVGLAAWIAPFTVPGGNPFTVALGLTPRSPFRMVAPALLETSEPAKTAKPAAERRSTDDWPEVAESTEAEPGAPGIPPNMLGIPQSKNNSAQPAVETSGGNVMSNSQIVLIVFTFPANMVFSFLTASVCRELSEPNS
jgi:hypothetical protein